MDKTTRRALRAIVHGLHREEAITKEQVVSVVGELYDAAEGSRDRRHGIDAGELDRLATEIGHDANIEGD
ncbi:MAG TPA: hypothetical protein VFO69_00025 [Allosphingosinicella sp.]|nr:hypothetical protein [Allosphingosinicella sp.]